VEDKRYTSDAGSVVLALIAVLKSNSMTLRNKLTLKFSLIRNSILHSRFIICGDTNCILSTADFNTASATSNYEAGIFTNNPKIIYGLINHFEQIWNDKQTKSFQG
jgi:phosphatidylserine/phosphatidylglycerophosphate/cardiolipin synthase-like enzyme